MSSSNEVAAAGHAAESEQEKMGYVVPAKSEFEWALEDSRVPRGMWTTEFKERSLSDLRKRFSIGSEAPLCLYHVGRVVSFDTCLFTDRGCYVALKGKDAGSFRYEEIASVGSDLTVSLKNGRQIRLPTLRGSGKKLEEVLNGIHNPTARREVAERVGAPKRSPMWPTAVGGWVGALIGFIVMRAGDSFVAGLLAAIVVSPILILILSAIANAGGTSVHGAPSFKEAGEDAVQWAVQTETEWVCVCGTHNQLDRATTIQNCTSCDRNRDYVLTTFGAPEGDSRC